MLLDFTVSEKKKNVIHAALKNNNVEILKMLMLFLAQFSSDIHQSAILRVARRLQTQNVKIADIKDNLDNGVLAIACAALNEPMVRHLLNETAFGKVFDDSSEVVRKQLKARVIFGSDLTFPPDAKGEILALIDSAYRSSSEDSQDEKREVKKFRFSMFEKIIQGINAKIKWDNLFQKIIFLYTLLNDLETSNKCGFSKNELNFLMTHYLQQLLYGIDANKISLVQYQQFKSAFQKKFDLDFEKTQAITGVFFDAEIIGWMDDIFKPDVHFIQLKLASIMVEFVELNDSLDNKAPAYLKTDKTLPVLFQQFEQACQPSLMAENDEKIDFSSATEDLFSGIIESDLVTDDDESSESELDRALTHRQYEADEEDMGPFQSATDTAFLSASSVSNMGRRYPEYWQTSQTASVAASVNALSVTEIENSDQPSNKTLKK